MSDHLDPSIKTLVVDNPAFRDAVARLEQASETLLEACLGDEPLEAKSRGGRRVLTAAQAYRTAENQRNRAIAEALRGMML